MGPGRAGYGPCMGEVRENPSAGEDFHEETPAEFAAQPDREFTKVPTSGADSSPADTDEKPADHGSEPDDDEEDRAATGEK